MTIQIGIIGGSGLYDMAELVEREERTLSTPFGDPSGPYVIGTLRGKRVSAGASWRTSPSRTRSVECYPQLQPMPPRPSARRSTEAAPT